MRLENWIGNEDGKLGWEWGWKTVKYMFSLSSTLPMPGSTTLDTHFCHAHFCHPLQVFLIPVVSCIHEVLAMSLGYFHVTSKVWMIFMTCTKLPNMVVVNSRDQKHSLTPAVLWLGCVEGCEGCWLWGGTVVHVEALQLTPAIPGFNTQ